MAGLSTPCTMVLSAAAASVGLCGLSGVPASHAWVAERTNVPIPVRDGQRLAADIYLPATPGAYPTVLIQTPYGRERFGAAQPDPATAEGLFDRDHYAYVVVDWRGFHGSQAARRPGWRPRYGQDGYDVVEWIARQRWSNGRVGTWGPSALGRVQFLTAQEQPPHLTCCVPLVAAEGTAYVDYVENGVLREAHVRLLDRLGFGVGRLVRGAASSTGSIYRLAALASHPERIQVPMLLITGWYDPGVARQMDTFRALQTRAGETTRRTARMVIGPWHHTALGHAAQGSLSYPGAANERDRVSRLFLDYWLRDLKNNGWEQEPAFRWWQMGEERWLSAESPGAVVTTERVLYLGADGSLRPVPPGREGVRTFRSDPRHPVPTVGGANVGYGTAGGMLLGPQDQRRLEARADVLVYSTEPLSEALRLFGSVMFEFRFRVDRPDASFAVRLCDVYPDGRSMLVCDGITRARYRDGSGRPSPVQPGAAYVARLSLPPTALTFVRGHRLRVSVAGSNYPRFALNPNTGADTWDAATAVSAGCTILQGGEHPSKLVVPVLRGRPAGGD